MNELLTIGEFAYRSGLSRSALRFYDQNELLCPRQVDDETGYRFYAVDQLDEALLLRQLRAAEMPVALIRRFLAASVADRARLLHQHTDGVRARLRAAERVADELHGQLAREARGAGDRWCRIDSDEFLEALELVRFAIARSGERPELAVVWLEARDQSLRLVTTDSYRLVVRDIVPSAVGDQPVCGAIANAQGAQLQDAVTGGSLLIWQGADGALGVSHTGRDTIIGGAREGFPDYERILSDLPNGRHGTADPRELEAALRDLPGHDGSVSMRLTATTLTMELDGQTASAPIHWTGSEIVVWLNRHYLEEAVKATVGPDLGIEVIDPLSPVTLRSADTGTLTVLTMPVRPSVASG